MPIITRYVLSELLKVFLVSLAGMTLFFLLFGLVKEAYQEGLGLKQILLLIPYVLPDALRFSVPATILFGACSVFGRLASGNEVIAIKASGISPMVLLWPAIALAFLVSLVAVWLNDVAVSWGRDGMTRVVIESVEEIAYGRLEMQHSYSSKSFAINVHDVVGKRMINPTITFQNSGEDAPTTIYCEEATMHSNLQDNTLTLSCRDAVFNMPDGSSADVPGVFEQVIPLDEASRKGGGTRSPSDLPMYAIPDEIAHQRSYIRLVEEQMAAKAAQQMISGDFVALTANSWNSDQKQAVEANQRLYRLQMEPYRRWANGFSCLCFVVLGAPLAIRMRNSDFLTSFFMCFLPILIFYYPLMAFGVSQAKSGTFPSWGVWAGNVILVVIGWRFTKRIIRY
jgi:lipopolysaccharide export system permease protein